MRRPLLLAVALLVAACGEEPGPGSRGCEPGSDVSCACAGDATGTATCGEDRLPGPCSCPGAVQWAPAVLDFGVVPRAVAREATLLLSSGGDLPIEVIDAAVDGDPGFEVVSAPAAVPGGGAGAPVVVSFSWPVPVEAEGVLWIRTAAGDVVVPLRAAIQGAQVECTPAELTWVEAPVGSRSSQSVVCTNVGLAGPDDPAVARLVQVRSDEAEFFGGAFSGGTSIGPRESLALQVFYVPRDLEADQGTVTLEFDHGLEVPVAVSGTAVGASCDLELTVTSSRGIPGQTLSGQIRLGNRRADAGCFVASLAPDPDCAAEFDLPSMEFGTLLLAGADITMAYQFRGEAVGDYACTLRAIADDPEGHEFTATAAVELSWRQCLVHEGVVNLPAVSPSCGASTTQVLVGNTCEGDVPVDVARIAEESDPGFAVPGFAPTVVPPHGLVAIPVAFDPEAEGAAFAGTLEVLSPLDPTPWAFPLAASSGPDDIYVDRAVQNRLEPIDVLVVIDNGAGMSPEAARMAAELGPVADARGYDYRLAVTSSGLAPEAGGGCPGGASGGEDGRFFPVDGARPRIVTPATPNARAVWEANLQVGTCHTAPARPLQAAALAVSPALNVADDPRHPEPADGNAGFLRPGVPLMVVVIGDRDDASPGTAASYYDALVAAKDGDPTLVFVVVVAGEAASGCVGGGGVSATAAPRLHAFANAAFLSLDTSICDAAWGVGNLFPDTRKTYFETAAPPADRNEDGVVDEADLEVRVGLAEVPALGDDGIPNWTWAGTQVSFSARAVPPPSALVEIERLYCPRAR